MFWTGPPAFSGWNASNADLVITDFSGGNLQLALEAGQYVPIRVAYWNGAGAGSFAWTITNGTGTVLVDSYNSSPRLLQYSCDLTTAPKYAQEIGSET